LLGGNGAGSPASLGRPTQPTNVPVVNDQILQALQGAAPTASRRATAEATPEAPAAPPPSSHRRSPRTPICAPGQARNSKSLGGTITGQAINIVGRNADGTWFRLDNGGWVFATLVANPPALESVPVVNNDGTPAAKPVATPAPAGGLGGLLPTPRRLAPTAPVTTTTSATGR
jgi:hypothetical protein